MKKNALTPSTLSLFGSTGVSHDWIGTTAAKQAIVYKQYAVSGFS